MQQPNGYSLLTTVSNYFISSDNLAPHFVRFSPANEAVKIFAHPSVTEKKLHWVNRLH